MWKVRCSSRVERKGWTSTFPSQAEDSCEPRSVGLLWNGWQRFCGCSEGAVGWLWVVDGVVEWIAASRCRAQLMQRKWNIILSSVTTDSRLASCQSSLPDSFCSFFPLLPSSCPQVVSFNMYLWLTQWPSIDSVAFCKTRFSDSFKLRMPTFFNYFYELVNYLFILKNLASWNI